MLVRGLIPYTDRPFEVEAGCVRDCGKGRKKRHRVEATKDDTDRRGNLARAVLSSIRRPRQISTQGDKGLSGCTSGQFTAAGHTGPGTQARARCQKGRVNIGRAGVANNNFVALRKKKKENVAVSVCGKCIHKEKENRYGCDYCTEKHERGLLHVQATPWPLERQNCTCITGALREARMGPHTAHWKMR